MQYYNCAIYYFSNIFNYNFFHNLENMGINMSYVEKIDLNNLLIFLKLILT